MINYIVLCEDQQQETFIRRFLKNKKSARCTYDRAPDGKISAEQYVRENYPKWLEIARKKRKCLVVMIDADSAGANKRMRELEESCKNKNTNNREKNEEVAIFIPARNIETWLAYLDGEEIEEDKSYPKLSRERDCNRHVKKLSEMCNAGVLPKNAPPSLKDACEEWARLP